MRGIINEVSCREVGDQEAISYGNLELRRKAQATDTYLGVVNTCGS